MTKWKQERPDWCRHRDCGFVFRSQDAACAGRLPVPEVHEGDSNTHRLCLRNQVEGEMVAELYWNRADAWHLGRLCKAVTIR